MDQQEPGGVAEPCAGQQAAGDVLLEVERRFQEVLDRASFAAAMLDVTGRVVYCNDALLAILRRRREEVEEKDWFDTNVPDSERAARRARFLSEVVSGRPRGRFEGEILAGDGSPRLFSWSIAMLRHRADGRIAGLTIFGEDVTDRRLAERQLIEQKALYEGILEGLVEGVWVADRLEVIRYGNPAAARLLEIPHPDMAGTPVRSVPALSSPKMAAAYAEARRTGLRIRFDHARVEGRDGERQFSGWMIPVPDHDGPQIIGTLSDETERHLHEEERRRMQERLALADRLASVGTLAAGMAHEVNNPLTYMSANLDFAVETLHTQSSPELAEVVFALQEAREGATRVRDIVRDLKYLARDDERESPIDVERVLERSLTIAMNQIRHRAQLVRRLGGVPPVNGNESRLGQVFLNLLVNAAQSIPEGRAGENRITVATSVVADGRVAVDVADSGSGIPSEMLSRIFDPFFTTKRVGEGMGLGLAICHGIVRGMGGEIEVESTVGAGTHFRVLFPPAHASLLGEPAAPAAAPSGRRGKVLVVEDEPLVARAVQRILSPEHDVSITASARDALRQLWSGRRFDVILCDVLMPDMTGMDFHDEMLRSAPAELGRLVFMTGGPFTDEGARAFLAEVKVPCLDKPVDAGQLRELVRRMMG